MNTTKNRTLLALVTHYSQNYTDFYSPHIYSSQLTNYE